ncbi:MAG: 16S rRNA (uracil(1498)-N(3))-methyltransferase [FCB group bacterium]|nr:16S rRNA (uracil(1498)-N(3))-methyltransferase [FCB group bacterium]
MADRIFFYVSPENITGDEFILDPDESHHFQRVLRKPAGTDIWLSNGRGTMYRALVEEVDGQGVSGTILHAYPGWGENRQELHLALAILKRDRMELAVEKAVELGVKSIQPVIMDRCVRRTVNIDRLSRIVVATAKQCGRSYFPEVKEPVTLASWLTRNNKKDGYVACHAEGTLTLKHWNESGRDKTRPVHVIIGPEGDFTPAELSLLKQHGIEIINLGKRRLRSETAVLVSLAILNELNSTPLTEEKE